MLLKSYFAYISAISAALAAQIFASPVEKRDFGPVNIFTPPSTYKSDKTLYGRQLMLTVNDNAGTLLTTWENYTPTTPYFPIYTSKDHGFTWKSLSKVTDQVNGWGLRYQPFLYELTQAWAGFPAGTILLAGNSIPSDLSKTKLDLYASKDKGVTWNFVSSIASGGKAVPNNGETPVWEPFLLLHKNQLICYYSDQRDANYGQKIVHQVSSDGKTWGPVVDDVAVKPYGSRPGMPVIAKLPNGEYIMTYEYFDASNPNAGFQTTFKLTQDPLSWNDKPAQILRSTDGYVPLGSPYVIWTPVGGVNGSIVANSGSSPDLFINRNLGNGPWTRLTTQQQDSYSRSLAVGFNPKDITIVGAGPVAENGARNKVEFSARDVNGCATCS
ncbi:Oligoxyloglucan reducing end-specific cellobiohydrolase [Violaceomyces palustris]|uniref:Oligoxyloglucan reducing end-specific cellobiohydrolase n=1 Tax=Violaceomyces palustris TaxID=1673888 RepID=A0ACD0P8M5_9BASI|nr:Oligoxyloglucan reducing end-specific cellobiohydrolase [Violaceomyces palustris]